jgi:hypothetical protein
MILLSWLPYMFSTEEKKKEERYWRSNSQDAQDVKVEQAYEYPGFQSDKESCKKMA